MYIIVDISENVFKKFYSLGLQVRVRVVYPPPHVTLHSEYSLQFDQRIHASLDMHSLCSIDCPTHIQKIKILHPVFIARKIVSVFYVHFNQRSLVIC